MKRLLPSLALVALAVAALSCSYVEPKAVTMADRGGAAPFFTMTPEDVRKGMAEGDPAAQSTTTAPPFYPGADVANMLTQKLQGEFLKHLAAERNIAVTADDRAYATQRAQTQSGTQPNPEVVERQAAIVAYGRHLAEEEFQSGRRDRNQLARDFYNQNPEAFGEPAQLCLHLMGFAAGTGAQPTEADYAAAQAKANTAKNRSAAETFEKVATEMSELQGRPGGDIGCVPESEVAQSFGAAATTQLKTLPNGTVADPIRGQGGYYLMRLDRQVAANQPSFEQSRALAEAGAARALGERLITQNLSKELEQVEVTIDPRYGSWDPRTGVVNPPSGAQTPTTPTTSTTEPSIPGLDPSGREPADAR